MQLDNILDLVGGVGLSVDDVELDGDAKVAKKDDDGRQDEVGGEHGDDEREAVGFHLSPGKGAGHSEGLRAVPTPAQ